MLPSDCSDTLLKLSLQLFTPTCIIVIAQHTMMLEVKWNIINGLRYWYNLLVQRMSYASFVKYVRIFTSEVDDDNARFRYEVNHVFD